MKAQKSNNFRYNKSLKRFARANRNNATKAEACIWKYALSKKKTGFTFKRQIPALNYIADFMCQELKLIIEVDGITHHREGAYQKDMIRQKKLESVGFTVLRFSDEAVLGSMDDVQRMVQEVIEGLTSSPKSHP